MKLRREVRDAGFSPDTCPRPRLGKMEKSLGAGEKKLRGLEHRPGLQSLRPDVWHSTMLPRQHWQIFPAPHQSLGMGCLSSQSGVTCGLGLCSVSCSGSFLGTTEMSHLAGPTDPSLSPEVWAQAQAAGGAHRAHLTCMASGPCWSQLLKERTSLLSS